MSKKIFADKLPSFRWRLSPCYVWMPSRNIVYIEVHGFQNWRTLLVTIHKGKYSTSLHNGTWKFCSSSLSFCSPSQTFLDFFLFTFLKTFLLFLDLFLGSSGSIFSKFSSSICKLVLCLTALDKHFYWYSVGSVLKPRLEYQKNIEHGNVTATSRGRTKIIFIQEIFYFPSMMKHWM